MTMRVIAGKKFTATLLAVGTLATGCQGIGPKYSPEDGSPRDAHWGLGEIQSTFKVFSLEDSGRGTLREAIQLANASPGADKIVFESEDDLYNKPQTIRLKKTLPKITENLLIDGYIEDMLWKASGVTLDGAGRHRILVVAPSAAVKIEYLTFSGGRAWKGGAIANNGDLVVSGMMFMQNAAYRSGGAIYNRGRLKVINSTFYANEAGHRGGAALNEEGMLSITHGTVTRNRAHSGGGIYNTGVLSLENSILYGNLGLGEESGDDCYSEKKARAVGVRNIMGNAAYCGAVFSDASPGMGEPGRYNGPTLSVPVSTVGPAFNWADNDLSLDENGEPLMWDQRGNGDPRYAAGIADIGAFEVQPITKMEVDTLDSGDVRACTSSASDCSLLGAIALTNSSDTHSTITFDSSIFQLPERLHLDYVPTIEKDLVIDASRAHTVTIGIGSQGFPIASEAVTIELRNVKLSE